MILALWPLQEMKGDEARHAVEMAVALQPDLLEVGSAPLRTLKRFMAMNILSFLPCSRQNSEEMPSFQAILAIRFSMPVSDT